MSKSKDKKRRRERAKQRREDCPWLKGQQDSKEIGESIIAQVIDKSSEFSAQGDDDGEE